jgi:hypothetical protein
MTEPWPHEEAFALFLTPRLYVVFRMSKNFFTPKIYEKTGLSGHSI